MTFKEWFHDYEWSPEKEAWGQSVWNAGQKAEREKYAELIAAAEAVIYGWEKTMHKGPDQTANAIYRMLDVVERMKEETE